MQNYHHPDFSLSDASVFDVILCGAGPVGLFLACELALARCSVLILEQAAHPHSPFKRAPFGLRGLSAPTIEAFARRGLLTQLELHKHLQNPHKTTLPTQGPRRQLGHFAGIPFHAGDIDASQWQLRLPGSLPTSLLSEMEELETLLARRAIALGVTIQRGLTLDFFTQNADSVTVQAGEQVFTGQWLVGCDGARSIVRKLGGFAFVGTEPEFTGYSTQVDIADPEQLKSGRNVTAGGMYLQSQPGFVIMQDFDNGAFHDAKEPITLAHAQTVLRRVSQTDVTLTALHSATTWSDRARQASAYRQGRIFLAGDAAHIHAPLGGQGLNLGIGDAMNLGWKLAATIRHTAPANLLDTYQTERHPVGAQVLDWSRAQVAIMKPTPQARALHAIIGDLMNTQDGATYFAGRVWGVHTCYDLNSDQALVGRSVPAFILEDGTRIDDLMQDGKAILLDFSPHSSFATVAGEYGECLRYVAGQAKEQLGLSALLIRPDGIVAWATGRIPDTQSLRASISCSIAKSGRQRVGDLSL
jgi:2-polyprenyl-6-methoxyphenol hydroxylase-like FAD-dependent oxidoreductase